MFRVEYRAGMEARIELTGSLLATKSSRQGTESNASVHCFSAGTCFQLAPFSRALLSQDFVHHAARFHAGQACVQALEFCRKSFVLDAQG
ncbi:MAG: hypothetical protein AAF958_15550, partial [Planctomycetota bacterium]